MPRATYDGDVKNYYFTIDPAYGTSEVFFNGVRWMTLAHNDWKRTGETIWWGGEVMNYEDDMAGTFNNECIMRGCQYYTGSWHYANSRSTILNYRQTDDTEWQIYPQDDTTLYIWDKDPY